MKPGDSLTKIAAEQLGDESRFREIFELNQGRPQPDGRTLHDVGLLRPGWTLALPDKKPEPCGDIVVEHGDTLSTIARDHLGDARRHLELFDLNRGVEQPGGRPLTDPDQIRVGTVLRLPKQNTGGGSAPAARAQAPVPCPPAVEPPVAEPPEPPPTAEPAPVTPEPPPSPPQSETDDSSVLPLLGVGSLLATTLLALIGAKRLRAQRQRRPGHRIQRPSTKLEADLEKASEPGTIEQLDQALRTLARSSAGLPAVRSVRVGQRGVSLELARPAEPMAPFRASESRTCWTLDPTASVPTQPDGNPPYPTLISLGYTTENDLLLINLAEVGAISLQGTAADIEAILLALAWELAASPWTRQTTALLIGFGETTAAHNGQFRFAPTIPDEFGQPDVILSTHDLPADLRTTAAVVTAGTFPGNWLLDVTTTRTVINELDAKIEMQCLSADQMDELLAALRPPDQVPAPTYREATGVQRRSLQFGPHACLRKRPTGYRTPTVRPLGSARLAAPCACGTTKPSEPMPGEPG